MTVLSTTFYTDWLAANGVQKDWPYQFAMFQASTIVVQVRDGLAGAVTEYTSDIGFYPTNDTEGYVKYPVAAAALPVGKYVRIVRRVGYTQETEIGNEGSFEPLIHERAFDKVTMQVQQIAEDGKRSLKVPLGSVGGEVIPGVSGNLVKFTAGGGMVDAGTSVAEVEADRASAEASALAALNSQNAAAASAGTALGAKNDAVTARDKAQLWANEAYETPVEVGAYSAKHWSTRAFWWGNQDENVEVIAGSGLFSAKHWAAKAQGWALTVYNGMAAWVHGAADKAIPDGADELGIASSTDAWGLRRLTLTNLADWLASLTQTLTNKTLTTPNVVDLLKLSSANQYQPQIQVRSTYNGTDGSFINFQHGRAAGASFTGDCLGTFSGQGRSTDLTWVSSAAFSFDVTAVGANFVDGMVTFSTTQAGSFSSKLYIKNGVWVGAAVGGDPGEGNINAKGYKVDGVSVVPSNWYTQAYSATITLNLDNGAHQIIVATGNPVIAAPINAKINQPLVVQFRQDATGGRVPAWSGVFAFGDYGTPVGSTGPNQIDIYYFHCVNTSGPKYVFTGFRKDI